MNANQPILEIPSILSNVLCSNFAASEIYIYSEKEKEKIKQGKANE
jgi:hypothetical protein